MAANVIVLDTHALLWWALDPEKVSARARVALEEMEQRGGYASAISIWEIAVKVKQDKLVLPLSVDELVRRLERGGVVELLPVTTDIWLRSVALPWVHRDPADRVIVATAQGLGCSVLSKDSQIQAFSQIECIW